jgi:hypothetical protein
MGVGAAFDTWRLPAELRERPEGPRLTLVDLIELRLAIMEPSWIEHLA